jgi:hypothetical protein
MSSSVKVTKGLQNIMLDSRGRQTLPRPVFLVLKYPSEIILIRKPDVKGTVSPV